MSEQWTDERIIESLPSTYLYSCWWTDKDKAIALAKHLRSMMQAEIAKRDAEIERLNRQIEDLQFAFDIAWPGASE